MWQNIYMETYTTHDHCWIQVFHTLGFVVPKLDFPFWGDSWFLFQGEWVGLYFIFFCSQKFYIRLESLIILVFAGISIFKQTYFVSIETIDPSCWRVTDLMFSVSSWVWFGKIKQTSVRLQENKEDTNTIKNKKGI